MRPLLVLFLSACNPESPGNGPGGDDGTGDDGVGDDGSGDDGGGGDGAGDDGAGDDGGGDDGTTDDSGTDDTGPDCTPIDYYIDGDHDGYGTGALLSDCEPPADAADVAGDCDDKDELVHPGQEDICNELDDDCDLSTDEDAAILSFYVDADGDGYGVPGAKGEGCAVPAGFSDLDNDCDDADASMSPGNPEDWTDGVENNCDGIMEIETPVEVPEATGNSWDAPTADPVKLRLLGVYESGGAAHVIDVVHDVPEAVILVVTSYDPVDWVITETYPGTIQQIIVSGPGVSTVTAPKGVAVDSYLGPAAFGFGFDWDDSSTRTLVAKAEDLTSLKVTSFHGSYNPASFTISPASDWMDVSAYPDCTKPPSGTAGGLSDIDALDAVACADVLDSAHVCLTGDGSTITAFGLDEGATCTAAALPSSFISYSGPSIAWSDEWVYACGGDYGLLQRASLLTGEIQKSYITCDGVSSVDGSLYVRDTSISFGSDVPVYATWDDATCGSPSYYAPSTSNSRVAVHNGTLYSTWHSTDTFDYESLSGAGTPGSVLLDGYKGWIWGLDVSDDGWFMFVGDSAIRWQSVDDGTYFGEMPIAAWYSGLACALH